ncbi:MAG: 2-octaprenyl-6-methoxyphenyl hydroxylase [Gammaproteobacteria bacterium]|nr:2-octaprenyl-6-methoxyphenyl hydroxylase [Gammaproteobacteria bacterium]NNJ51113.1 2-octaprenyl-6-methoxyphenyl hydroxylase [Gammaproteobacteria bacterium]
MPGSSVNNHYDLIIIGGGLAGASLACALKSAALEEPLKIAVVEAYELNTESQPSYDDRTIALSYGSRCIFDSMGVWPLLAEQAEAIDSIHISDRGHFGVTRLSSEQEGVEALGYVLENRNIGQQLYRVMHESADITLFCPAELKSLQQDFTHPEGRVSVDVMVDGSTQTLTAELLVAADGNNSQVMKVLNIGSSRKDYEQSALITNVTPGKKHENVAYERFTDSGPLAFLPMTQNRCSVVWTLSPEQADYLYALDEADFLAQLQQRFGYRLGRIKKIGMRHIYPLFLQSATQMVHGRVALIGNAAHSVHPVAGQGFNLALRDVALLSELIVEQRRKAADIGSLAMLQQYETQRDVDIKRVYRFTDALVRTFSNSIPPLAHMRSLGLFMVDILPDLKHQLAVQSMGLNAGKGGKLSRLGRGLPL